MLPWRGKRATFPSAPVGGGPTPTSGRAPDVLRKVAQMPAAGKGGLRRHSGPRRGGRRINRGARVAPAPAPASCPKAAWLSAPGPSPAKAAATPCPWLPLAQPKRWPDAAPRPCTSGAGAGQALGGRGRILPDVAEPTRPVPQGEGAPERGLDCFSRPKSRGLIRRGKVERPGKDVHNSWPKMVGQSWCNRKVERLGKDAHNSWTKMVVQSWCSRKVERPGKDVHNSWPKMAGQSWCSRKVEGPGKDVHSSWPKMDGQSWCSREVVGKEEVPSRVAMSAVEMLQVGWPSLGQRHALSGTPQAASKRQGR